MEKTDYTSETPFDLPLAPSCCSQPVMLEQVLATTESVCPECLARIPARRVARGEDVYLEKSCPRHGFFRTIIWRGQPAFSSWVRPKIPTSPQYPFTQVQQGCPFDCGLCPDHRQQPCCVLLEVTQRCDLTCTFCFAGAGSQKRLADPSLAVIEGWYQRLLVAGGPFNIQLSGGEPCVRDDLPDIIALGRSLGFTFFQVNTNGLRLSRDPAFGQQLKEAGLSTVFLQFDGTRDEIQRKMRGGKLLARKKQAIERCAEHGLGVVLVPTLVPGINTDNIGDIIRLALEYAPAVRGVHFQPVSYFGRYPQPPGDADRITIPEVIRAIEEQTGGLVRQESFKPPGGENAMCSFHANFVLMADGSLTPLTRHNPDACCCGLPATEERADEGAVKSRLTTARQWSAPQPVELQTGNGPSLGGWDELLARARTHTFCISGMAFQDAWNLDLERLRDCYIINVSPAGGLVPFCAYNLTDRQGRSLYRNIEQTDQAKSISLPIINPISGPVNKEAACCLPATGETTQKTRPGGEPHRSGCMICGADLIYLETDRDTTCYYCGQVVPANARCANGHFVCDACHRADAVEIIKQVCLHSRETDPVTLMQTIRSHSHFRIHGPEHHSLVPAVILTALRNSGSPVTDEQVMAAIQRGQTMIGGSCAFLGACGAAIGVGIAVSLLLGANPYDGDKRQMAQRATQAALGEIASYNAPRCCQRDSWLALKEASTLLQVYTGISLSVRLIACEQFSENKECIHDLCPLWPSRQ